MPTVNGKHYPYTSKGIASAQKAARSGGKKGLDKSRTVAVRRKSY